jgi:hypothetical protein
MSIIAERSDEMARDNEQAVRLFRSFSNMLLNLPRAVGIKARDDASAAIAKARAEGLEGSLNVDTFADNWNDGRAHGNRSRDVNLGRQEAMAGGRGAEKFVSDYATNHAQSDELVRGYAAMADELASQSKRVAEVEKGIRAIATYLAGTVGKSFPEDETEKRGDESDDTEEKRDDDDEETSKGGMRTVSIPKLMRELSRYSKSGARGLAEPPDLSPLRKAGPSTIERVADAIDHLEDWNDQIHARTLLSRLHLSQTNAEAYGRFVEGMGKASPHVRAIFQGAGVTVSKASGPAKIVVR